MSRVDEVFALFRELRDQFGVFDDLVRGFRDKAGMERRRRWEEHRRAALTAVSRAQRLRVRRGVEAAVLASGGVVFLIEGAAWTWLAVPLAALSALRASQVRAVAIPPGPSVDDPAPIVFPDAPRGSRTGDLLRRAAAARDAVDGMLPLIRASAGGLTAGLAEAVSETRDAAERTVADLGTALLGLEHLIRRQRSAAAMHGSCERLGVELERAVAAFEDLAATVAHRVTESGTTAAYAEFEASLAGVKAVLRTLQPAGFTS